MDCPWLPHKWHRSVMTTPWLHKSFSGSDPPLAMKTPNSKIAIATGASRGIGAAIARRLGTDGFTVVVNYGEII